MSSHSVDVSVVVPVYNRADQLRCLLDSFERLAPAPTFEIIIVDDCSTDPSVEALAREWTTKPLSFDARYIRLKKNAGPAVARNRGVAEAKANIIAFTDSDCRVEPHWLQHLIKRLDRKAGIVGVGGRVLPVNTFGFISGYNTFNRILEPSPLLNYLITANCCYYRDQILAAGGFDEGVRFPGGEDIGLSIRIILHDGKFAYEPEAIVYHDYRESVLNFLRTWKNYAHGNGYVVAKYFGPMWTRPAPDAKWNPLMIMPPGIKYRHIRHFVPSQYLKCKAEGVPIIRTLVYMWLRWMQMYIHIWYFAKGEEACLGKRTFRDRFRICWHGYI